ncbi:MAG: dTDP-glucose 4,6-dehydratase [Akkermansiaceae bacterium]
MNEAGPKSVLVTGAAGFIGVNLVTMLLERGYRVRSLDALTYAGRKESLAVFENHPNHDFVQLDVADEQGMMKEVLGFSPDWIFHLAAETHVDRSIIGPMEFLRTNVMGTGCLLQAALACWKTLEGVRAEQFRFIHCSTDEVFGSLEVEENAFTEDSNYQPRSPYSASKAGSDHLVRAWGVTYGLPVILTNCSNNYGPFQLPEKLIPLVITRAFKGRKIPVYGNGLQVRDWIHVEDHCEAQILLAESGVVGSTYLIGGGNEWKNIELIELLCNEVREMKGGSDRTHLIEFVTDRLGHDARYSVDISKIREELGWFPKKDFRQGLRETIEWYSSHADFWKDSSE